MHATLARFLTLALTAVVLTFSSGVSAQLVLPYTETFSSGSEGLNSSSGNTPLSFNNLTYSVDGNGGVGIFNMPAFMGTTYSSISGFGVIGDYAWTGSTANNVHNFTFSSNGGVKFSLGSMDFVTGNAGPPTVFTITGYSGVTQKAQVTGFDLASLTSTTYATGTAHELSASNIGPGDNTGYGQHMVFSGGGWGSIDRVVLTSTGNDALVGLDNIQLNVAVVPEPSHYACLFGLGLAGWALVRRTKAKVS